LLGHLEPMLLSPKMILDLGCATGQFSRQLAKRYSAAQVIGVDESKAMLREAGRCKPWFSKQKYLEENVSCLPFDTDSIDYVFSNLTPLFVEDTVSLFKEIQRMLKPGGLFLFSSLGPGCISEKHEQLIDMHHLGDQMMQANLSDPVMESEEVTLVYEGVDQLKQEFVSNRLSLFSDELIEKNTADCEDGVSFTFEVLYGHAWGTTIPSGVAAANQGVVEISLESLKRQK
jgi:malonyl-CoA O-methyltransferase